MQHDKLRVQIRVFMGGFKIVLDSERFLVCRNESSHPRCHSNAGAFPGGAWMHACRALIAVDLNPHLLQALVKSLDLVLLTLSVLLTLAAWRETRDVSLGSIY